MIAGMYTKIRYVQIVNSEIVKYTEIFRIAKYQILTLKRQHVLSEIVAVLEDDGVVLVKLVGQLVGILPHEPERLLGRVH